MPRMSAASKASRRVTTKVAPILFPGCLLGDDGGFGCLGVVLAHEGVLAGLERRHLQAHRLASGDDLLDAGLGYVELFRPLVLVGDDEDERRAGLDLDDV